MFTHAQRLERWLAPEVVNQLSASARGWYGPPIPVGNVPGAVFVRGDGEFVGPIRGGGFAGLQDWMTRRTRRWARSQMRTVNAGFSTLEDLIVDRGVYRRQWHHFAVNSSAPNSAGVPVSAWRQYAIPTAGASTGGTSGTGRVLTSATQGAIRFVNPPAGEQTYFTRMRVFSSGLGGAAWFVAGLYDRLWDMTFPHSSVGGAIDAANRPTRYQTTATAVGNFIGSEVSGTLGSTSRTCTIQYTNQDESAKTAFVETFANPTSANEFWPAQFNAKWHWLLATGDIGVRYLTDVTLSTTSTGANNWWLGHMLGFLPTPTITAHSAGGALAYYVGEGDGINSAFAMTRVYDDACLAIWFMSPGQGDFMGELELVQG